MIQTNFKIKDVPSWLSRQELGSQQNTESEAALIEVSTWEGDSLAG